MAYKIVTWKVFFDGRDQRIQDNSQYVKSPAFVIAYPQCGRDAKYLQWNLSFYPNGLVENMGSEKSIAIFVRNKHGKSDRAGCDLRLKLALLDRDENEAFVQTREVAKENMSEARNHGFAKFVSHVWINANRDKVLVNNHLTFKVEFTLFDQERVMGISVLDKTNQQLSVYRDLFASGDMSDLTLVSSDLQELKCHRIILMSHSMVFRELLMADPNNHTLHIPEFDIQVISELARFIYSKKVQNIEEIVFDLYRACNKFQIADLGRDCYRLIINNLNEGNVLETLRFADETKNNMLAKKCYILIKSNWGIVRDTLDWASLTAEENFKIVDFLCKDMAEISLNE